MKKNFAKNNIITILLIITVAFFIVGQFLPVSYYVHSEFASQTFYDWNDEIEWNYFCYTLFSYTYICDNSYADVGEKPIVQERILLLYMFPVTLSYDERPSVYNLEYFETNINVELPRLYMANAFMLISFVVGLFALYYFIKFLKELNKKPTKVPFFLGILYLSVIVMIHLGIFFMTASADSYGLVKANYVKLGYGFYYQLVVVVILFLIYFIQNKPKFLKNIF